MNDQERRPRWLEILLDMLGFAMWGIFIGPILGLIFAFCSGGFISIGFGFAGLLYYPLFAALLGGLVGALIGFVTNL